jgi:hypothetical protein
MTRRTEPGRIVVLGVEGALGIEVDPGGTPQGASRRRVRVACVQSCHGDKSEPGSAESLCSRIAINGVRGMAPSRGQRLETKKCSTRSQSVSGNAGAWSSSIERAAPAFKTVAAAFAQSDGTAGSAGEPSAQTVRSMAEPTSPRFRTSVSLGQPRRYSVNASYACRSVRRGAVGNSLVFSFMVLDPDSLRRPCRSLAPPAVASPYLGTGSCPSAEPVRRVTLAHAGEWQRFLARVATPRPCPLDVFLARPWLTYNLRMSEPTETPGQRIERLVEEAGGRPKVFGPHFDRLVSVIEEEVNVDFAMRRFGEDQPLPDPQRVHTAAILIADAVDDAFRLEPRNRGRARRWLQRIRS